MKTSQSASSIEINKRDGRIRSNSGINHKKNQISSNSKSTWQLIRISKFVYYESFLEGSFKTAGRDRVLNEYKDGVSYAKQNSIMMKILASFMLIILNIITIYSLKQFLEVLPFVNEYNFSAFLFAISSISSLNCVMQLLYLFTFGMTGLMGIFGGSAFKFLETLPLENEEIEKIVFFAFLRTIDYQLIVMFLGLPIVTAFMTQNVIATVTAILVSGLHLILGISIMVFISNVMAKKIFNLSNSSKFNGFLKIFVTFLYVMITLSLGSMFSFIGSMVQTLFVDNLISGETGAIINLILSFIPYPFGLNYLYG
ncbi:MAG: hypothetical protein GY870_21705, partial [archaeon]|nr:hypothetical protein [archaeon]